MSLPEGQVDSFTTSPVAFSSSIVRPLRRSSRSALLLLGATVSLRAGASEPLRPSEPRPLNDSVVDLLQVPDALDDLDVIDLDLRLTFDHSMRRADIRRETSINQPGLATGGYIADTLDVATYNESIQRLIPAASIGILPDLALTVKLPIILAHNQRLGTPASGGSSISTMGLVGEQLFQVPFTSPTRSGIEHLAIALDLGVMNQWRNPAQPNWTIGLEGRFNVSEAMHACNPNSREGQVACAHPADRNRNGRADAFGDEYGALAGRAEGNFSGERNAGVSRGTTQLEARAYVSKRMGYIEPYSGVAAQFEFASPGSDFGLVDLETSLANHPPLRGTLIFGLAIVPWEEPERHRRLSIDMRARGTYVSEGRDYSELFDALGSSSAPSLRDPQFAKYKANTNTTNGEPDAFTPSVVDTNSQRVSFTGLTDVQQHGDYDLSARLTWQAGEYISFDVGAEWRVIQGHLITYDQACNPVLSGNPTESGPCKYVSGTESDGRPIWQSTGKPNPNYRRTINEPGHRFRVDTSHGFRAWVSARVLF